MFGMSSAWTLFTAVVVVMGLVGTFLAFRLPPRKHRRH